MPTYNPPLRDMQFVMHEVLNVTEDLRQIPRHAETDADTINRVVAAVTQVHASPAVRQYIVDLVTRSRSTTALRLGASPRAGLHLLRAARAQAALEGRDHVIPDDVQSLAVAVLSHRLMPSSETQLARRTTAEVVTDLLRHVPVPSSTR